MNVQFGQLWEKILIHHGENTVSDHKTLLLECAINGVASPRGGSWRFHLETMWMKEERFEDVVKEAWTTNTLDIIDGRIKHCTLRLNQWNVSSFKRVKKEIKQLKRENGRA